MREYKFRGKDSKGEWRYGFLFYDYDCTDKYSPFINWKDEKYLGGIGEEQVEEETVGQFTGLYDKNGKEIYEGDIILTQPLRDKPFSQKAKTKRLKGIVKYIIKCGKSFVDDQNKVRYWGAEFDVEIIDKKDYAKYCNCGWGLFFECEVIGNIYDNKELLEGE